MEAIHTHFFAQPSGEYLSRSKIMALSQAKRKYSRALSFGTWHILAADTAENVLRRLARIPGGGSKVNIREALRRLTGT